MVTCVELKKMAMMLANNDADIGSLDLGRGGGNFLLSYGSATEASCVSSLDFLLKAH